MWHRLARAAAVLLLLSACSEVDDPTAPPTPALRTEEGVVAAIEVSPSEAHLELGETQQFRAQALDRHGRPLDVPVTWSSSDPRVAMVDRTGLATALSLGLARINMAAQGVMAVAELATYPVSRIAWRRDGDIWAMNGLGNSQIALAMVTDAGDPSWSPDGARIAFARADNIWVMNADGTGQTGLTSLGQDESPRWSPGGAAIVFNRWLFKNGEPEYPDLWLITPAGGALTQVTFGANSGAISSEPTWSPAGDKLAFDGIASGSFTNDIFVVNADGTGLTNLGQDAATTDLSPDWSPDGSKIAFHRGPGGQYLESEIYVMNADGSGQTDLTGGLSGADPAWSPDGSRILFENVNANDLYIMNADGSGVMPLTYTPSTSEDQASWSPDGERIVFRCDEDICVITADGSKTWNLTSSPLIRDDHPVWRP